MNGNGIKSSGRSSSQRSINDYPEHLNPFYEEENHKRLRFWKLGTDKTNRSNSFSIDGLKGLWSFKTFKLKKKSSTLGINKTSESPPMLRRDDDRYGSQMTYDGSMRHTVDIGLENNFQRGAPCRSSLQDLNSIYRNQGENSFIRNNRYRSTIQAGNSGLSQQDRTQSNTALGSVTPVFRSRYNNQPISRGSSQLSVNGSNPFDDEYETISQIGSPQRSSIRYSARKKRRAPPPPVSPNKPATVDESKAECEADNDLTETVNITNLTAEIESFVRTADTDTETIKSKENEATALKIEENNIETIEIKENGNERNEKLKTSRQSPESNDYYPQDDHCEEITIEKIQNLGMTDVNSNERCKKSPVKILIRAPTDEEPILEMDEDPKLEHKEFENENYDAKDTEQEIVIVKQDVKEFEDNDKVVSEKMHEENIVNGADKVDPKETVENGTECTRIVQDIDESTTPTSSAVEFILENENMTDVIEVTTELKITESNDDLSKIEPEKSLEHSARNEEEKPTNGNDRNNCVSESNRSTMSRFEVQTVPLKLDSPKIRKKDTAATDGGQKREPPTPPQRRRSVKEIIESINKCQSLLKVNQDPKADKTEKEKLNHDLYQASSSSMKSFKGKSAFTSDRNMNDSTEKPYQNKRMFSDITIDSNDAITEDMSNIPLFVEKFNEFNHNNPNSIFEKCVLRDNKTSNEEKVSNKHVEWNPVPKPRRHRNSTQGSIN